MKGYLVAILCGVALTLVGCNKDTSGGPGASSPPAEKTIVGQTDNTFSMDVPSLDLSQGETEILTIGIDRGTNFSEDVKLMLEGLPKGVTVDPASPVIKHGDKEAKLKFSTAGDAALGDFTVKVMGHPTKGAVAESELKITVTKLEPKDVVNSTADAAKVKLDDYTIAMQKQFDQFSVKYAELKERAAKAEGQAKADLDAKLAVAKTKLDAAAVKLEELKSASADRWEKVKEGVGNAFDELKTIFE